MEEKIIREEDKTIEVPVDYNERIKKKLEEDKKQ